MHRCVNVLMYMLEHLVKLHSALYMHVYTSNIPVKLKSIAFLNIFSVENERNVRCVLKPKETLS